MFSSSEQIVTAFEVNKMTPEEIAADFDCEVAAVKSILMQSSSFYRQACKTDDNLTFTDDEERMARQAIANIVRYTDDEHLRLRAAIYIRDDKKGRLDVVQASKGLNINLIAVNEQMRRAMEAVAKSKALPAGKANQVIDINVPSQIESPPASVKD